MPALLSYNWIEPQATSWRRSSGVGGCVATRRFALVLNTKLKLLAEPEQEHDLVHEVSTLIFIDMQKWHRDYVMHTL